MKRFFFKFSSYFSDDVRKTKKFSKTKNIEKKLNLKCVPLGAEKG